MVSDERRGQQHSQAPAYRYHSSLDDEQQLYSSNNRIHPNQNHNHNQYLDLPPPASTTSSNIGAPKYPNDILNPSPVGGYNNSNHSNTNSTGRSSFGISNDKHVYQSSGVYGSQAKAGSSRGGATMGLFRTGATPPIPSTSTSSRPWPSSNPNIQHTPSSRFANPPDNSPIDDEGEQTLDPSSSEAIRCICGFSYDDGFSIACDSCSKWVHAQCFGISSTRVPEVWLCEECHPREEGTLDLRRARERQIAWQRNRVIELEREQGRAATAVNGLAQVSGVNGGGGGKRRASSPGVEKKPRRSTDSAQGTAAGTKRKRRPPNSSTGAPTRPPNSSAGPSIRPPNSAGPPLPSSAAASTVNGGLDQIAPSTGIPMSVDGTPLPGERQDSPVDITSLDWATESYVHISQDIIPHQATRDQLRAQAAQWRGVTAFSDPNAPVFLDATNVSKPTEGAGVNKSVLPVPLLSTSTCSPHAIQPPSYALHTTTPISSHNLITPFTSTITPSSHYVSDPLNSYAHLGLPRPFVHLLGPPFGVALDARVTGCEGRWVRNGCRPNAVLRPMVCPTAQKDMGKRDDVGEPFTAEDGKKDQGEDETLAFGVFAVRDLKANEEVVLGWEWDDGHAVHSLPALLECPNLFPSPQHIAHMRFQMANILHTLGSTFTTCACGNKASDCALAMMAAFVEKGVACVEREAKEQAEAQAQQQSQARSQSQQQGHDEAQSRNASQNSPQEQTRTHEQQRMDVEVVVDSTQPPVEEPSSSKPSPALPDQRVNPMKVDLGPLVGATRGFRTRELAPGSGGMGGLEILSPLHASEGLLESSGMAFSGYSGSAYERKGKGRATHGEDDEEPLGAGGVWGLSEEGQIRGRHPPRHHQLVVRTQDGDEDSFDQRGMDVDEMTEPDEDPPDPGGGARAGGGWEKPPEANGEERTPDERDRAEGEEEEQEEDEETEVQRPPKLRRVSVPFQRVFRRREVSPPPLAEMQIDLEDRGQQHHKQDQDTTAHMHRSPQPHASLPDPRRQSQSPPLTTTPTPTPSPFSAASLSDLGVVSCAPPSSLPSVSLANPPSSSSSNSHSVHTSCPHPSLAASLPVPSPSTQFASLSLASPMIGPGHPGPSTINPPGHTPQRHQVPGSFFPEQDERIQSPLPSHSEGEHRTPTSSLDGHLQPKWEGRDHRSVAREQIHHPQIHSQTQHRVRFADELEPSGWGYEHVHSPQSHTLPTSSERASSLPPSELHRDQHYSRPHQSQRPHHSSDDGTSRQTSSPPLSRDSRPLPTIVSPSPSSAPPVLSTRSLHDLGGLALLAEAAMSPLLGRRAGSEAIPAAAMDVAIKLATHTPPATSPSPSPPVSLVEPMILADIIPERRDDMEVAVEPVRCDEEHGVRGEDEQEDEPMREEEEEEEHRDDVEMEEEEEEHMKEIGVDAPVDNVDADGDRDAEKPVAHPGQEVPTEQQLSIFLDEVSQRSVKASDASSAPSDRELSLPQEQTDRDSSSNDDTSVLLESDIARDAVMELTGPHSRNATPTDDAFTAMPGEDDIGLPSASEEEGLTRTASRNDVDIEMEGSTVLPESGQTSKLSPQEQLEHEQESTQEPAPPLNSVSPSPAQVEHLAALQDPLPSIEQPAPPSPEEPAATPEPPAPKKLSLQDFINRKRQKQKEERNFAPSVPPESAEATAEPLTSVAEAEVVDAIHANVVEMTPAADVVVPAPSVLEAAETPSVPALLEEAPGIREATKVVSVANSELADVSATAKAAGDQPAELNQGQRDAGGVAATFGTPAQHPTSFPMDVSGPSREPSISPIVNGHHVISKLSIPTRTPRPGTRFSPQKPSTYVPNAAWLTKVELADDPPIPPARTSPPPLSSDSDARQTHNNLDLSPHATFVRQAPPHTQSSVRPRGDSNATLAPSISVLQRSNLVASAEDGEIVNSGSGTRTPTPTLKPAVPLYSYHVGSRTGSGGIGKPRIHTPPTQPRSFGAANNSNTPPNTGSPGGLPRRPSVHGDPSPTGSSRSWSPVQGRAPPSGPRALRNGSAPSHPYYGAGRGGAPPANAPFAPRGERERSGWNGTPTGPRGGGAGRGR